MLIDGTEDYLQGRNTKKAQAVVWYSNELEKAEKLKTSEDFRREKAEKEKEEKELKERQQQEAYKSSDVGRIEKNIKEAFEEWNKKGEFEKQADYEERLKTQSQEAFSRICMEKVKSRIKYKKDELYGGGIKVESLVYNADSESFSVSFKIPYEGTKWQSLINIPIAQAEDFKREFYDPDCEVGDYNWCFVGNTLYPTLVTIYSEYKFPLLEKKQTEITFSFDDFGIANPYLKGFVCNYSTAVKQAEKQQAEEKEKQERLAEEQAKERMRLDSLECKKYNQKLDSIVRNYNQKLLQNEYNLKKQQIKIVPIEYENSCENKFTTAIENAETEYNEISKQIEQYKNTIENFTKQENLVNYVFRTCGSAGRASDSPTYQLSFINTTKETILREKLIEIAVDTNRQLNKEWVKNGQYFNNKTDFYESYISSNCLGHANTSLNENYKIILKQKIKNTVQTK